MTKQSDEEDADLRAAIAASLRDLQKNSNSRTGQSSSSVSAGGGGGKEVVDLTADSDNDELVEVFPKSKSTVGSETDEEEDEDLKRAIALSLQQVQDGASPPLSSSSPKSQQRQQRSGSEAASKKEQRASAGDTSSTTAKETSSEPTTSTSTPTPASAPASQPYGILGSLDRKKMEQERLARLAAKRKAEESGISPPSTGRQPKMARSEGSPLLNNNYDKNSSSSTENSRSTVSSLPQSSSTPRQSTSNSTKQTTTTIAKQNVAPSSTPGIQFPNGVVKKTWAFGCPRKGDDIKLEEVFQKSDLELAVLSAFQWNMEWLFSKLDMARSRFLLVMQAKEESTVSSPCPCKCRLIAMFGKYLCYPVFNPFLWLLYLHG